MPRKPKAPAATTPVATTAVSVAVRPTDFGRLSAETTPKGWTLAANQLPLHSPLGASSSERWMNCPGSTVLAAAIGPTDDIDDPEYRRDGILAHELASVCLKNGTDCWEETAGFPTMTPEYMAPVQTYLNYVRSLGEGQQFIEHRVHLPEFHPQFYGTVDFALVHRSHGIHIVDYKHGEGVAVEVENNSQLMYYAFGFIEADPTLYNDDETVTLTIVQPRMPWHPGGSIRSWDTTAGNLRRWAYEELRPAMEYAHDHAEFTPGNWCLFCPAHLLCPAVRRSVDLLVEATTGVPDVMALTEEQMARYYQVWEPARLFFKTLDERIYRLFEAGRAGPELRAVAKLVRKRSIRVWAENAQAAVEAKFGIAAFTRPELISPAAAEELPGGVALVKEFAIKPEGALTLVPIGNSRRAVEVKSIEEKLPLDLGASLW